MTTTIKVLNAHDWTDRQGRKYQVVSVLIEGADKVILNPSDQFKVMRDGMSVGVVRFLGIVHANYLVKEGVRPIELSVASSTNVKEFIGTELVRL